MILDAVPQDETAVIKLLRQSHEAAGFHRDDGGFSFAFDPAYAQRLFMAHLMAPEAICLVLKPGTEEKARGVLMACTSEHPFGPVKIAKETVWFIDPLYRGISAIKMLDEYEHWAEARDCQFAGMAGMGDDPDVAKLYRRRGYQAAEVHFLKAL